jgi:hypothetical protein
MILTHRLESLKHKKKEIKMKKPQILLIRGILIGEFLQSIDLQLGSFSVFLNIFDDLEGHCLIAVGKK